MKKKLFFLLLFSIAMAYVEAMVVVYLRRLVPLEIWEKAVSYTALTNLIRDVLFLIPLPWVAPVLVPVLVSLCMIMCGSIILVGRTRSF